MPHDIGYWGPDGPDISRWAKKAQEMQRGAAYKNTGTVKDGAKGTIRKLGGGRKERQMSSDYVEQQESNE